MRRVFHVVLLLCLSIPDCVLDRVSCSVCIKPDALLLLRGFWRTKRFIIIHESHFCRNKKMMLCIVPQVSFNLFQDDQYLANRHLHRTNDPHMLSSLQTTHRLSHLRLPYSSLHTRCMFSRGNSQFRFRSILPQYLPTWSHICGIRAERPCS